MLTDWSRDFADEVDEIRYHYGAWQERFDRMMLADPRYVFLPVPFGKI